MADRPLRKKKKITRPSRRLRAFELGEGRPNITAMRAELADMTDVLMGRAEPPIDAGRLTLMEVADAYFARASELTALIQQAEVDGYVAKGGNEYKFRTGELRTFMEMAKRAADLGSRRLTNEQLNFDMAKYGRESAS